jgi:hypothetical protein
LLCYRYVEMRRELGRVSGRSTRGGRGNNTRRTVCAAGAPKLTNPPRKKPSHVAPSRPHPGPSQHSSKPTSPWTPSPSATVASSGRTSWSYYTSAALKRDNAAAHWAFVPWGLQQPSGGASGARAATRTAPGKVVAARRREPSLRKTRACPKPSTPRRRRGSHRPPPPARARAARAHCRGASPSAQLVPISGSGLDVNAPVAPCHSAMPSE